MSFESKIKTWQTALKTYDNVAKKMYRKINKQLDDQTLSSKDLANAIELLGTSLVFSIINSRFKYRKDYNKNLGAFLDKAEEMLFHTISKLDSKLATLDQMDLDSTDCSGGDTDLTDNENETDKTSDEEESDDAIFSDEN